MEVNDGFAMNHYIALFFDLEEMLIPKDKELNKITKRLDEMKILFRE